MRELAGKVAVVTGGASGIGRALAEVFCRIFTHPGIARREIQARAAWMLNDASTTSPDHPAGTEEAH